MDRTKLKSLSVEQLQQIGVLILNLQEKNKTKYYSKETLSVIDTTHEKLQLQINRIKEIKNKQLLTSAIKDIYDFVDYDDAFEFDLKIELVNLGFKVEELFNQSNISISDKIHKVLTLGISSDEEYHTILKIVDELVRVRDKPGIIEAIEALNKCINDYELWGPKNS